MLTAVERACLQSAAAAGMKVLAVPSITDKKAYSGCECAFLASLLAFNPTDYGLPAFDDLVAGTVPLDPVWRLKGPVVKGFGRGSRVCKPDHTRQIADDANSTEPQIEYVSSSQRLFFSTHSTVLRLHASSEAACVTE